MFGRIVLGLGVVLLLGGCAGSADTSATSGNRIAIAVTDSGFVPASASVSAGKPITLVVTRKTEATCAKEIVFADQNIRKELPLNQAVEVMVPASEKGELSYTCGMGMVSGKLIVQ